MRDWGTAQILAPGEERSWGLEVWLLEEDEHPEGLASQRPASAARAGCPPTTTGSSIGSRWVSTTLLGTASRTCSSICSSRSCPRCTVQSPGTSMWNEMNRRAPAWRVLSAW